MFDGVFLSVNIPEFIADCNLAPQASGSEVILGLIALSQAHHGHEVKSSSNAKSNLTKRTESEACIFALFCDN